MVINNVKENKVKSKTIHYCLSREIKASEPPGCLVRRPDPRAPLFLSATWNVFRKAPLQEKQEFCRTDVLRMSCQQELERQPDIILGERRRRRTRVEDVIQLGGLHLGLEGLVREGVQERGHPPGKALGFPYPR